MTKQEKIENPRITVFWYKPEKGHRFRWRFMKSTWQYIILMPCGFFGVNIYIRFVGVNNGN